MFNLGKCRKDTWPGGGGGGGGGRSLLLCVGHTMECLWCMGGGSLLLCLESLDNAMECVVHGWDVLNKRGSVRPFHAIGANPSTGLAVQ